MDVYQRRRVDKHPEMDFPSQKSEGNLKFLHHPQETTDFDQDQTCNYRGKDAFYVYDSPCSE